MARGPSIVGVALALAVEQRGAGRRSATQSIPTAVVGACERGFAVGNDVGIVGTSARSVSSTSVEAESVVEAVALLLAVQSVVICLAPGARARCRLVPEAELGRVEADALTVARLALVADSMAAARRAAAACTGRRAARTKVPLGAIIARPAKLAPAPVSSQQRLVAHALVRINVVAVSLLAVGGAARHEGEGAGRDGGRGRRQRGRREGVRDRFRWSWF